MEPTPKDSRRRATSARSHGCCLRYESRRRRSNVIGMWGAARSGKTTFLVALHHEIRVRQEKDERWGMMGKTQAAHKLLLDGYDRFAVQHNFPKITEVSAL